MTSGCGSGAANSSPSCCSFNLAPPTASPLVTGVTTSTARESVRNISLRESQSWPLLLPHLALIRILKLIWFSIPGIHFFTRLSTQFRINRKDVGPDGRYLPLPPPLQRIVYRSEILLLQTLGLQSFSWLSSLWWTLLELVVLPLRPFWTTTFLPFLGSRVTTCTSYLCL